MTTYYISIASEITLNISYEEVKTLLLKTLKRVSLGSFALKGVSKGCIDEFYSQVAKLAVESGLVSNPDNQPGIKDINEQHKLSKKYEQTIRDIFWDLVIEDIVRPGSSETQPGFPGYHITEKGKTVIESAPQLG
jgi:hypothetical protein